MNITSKSRYALKIMMDLAQQRGRDDGGVTHRGTISARQGIPLDYMDHVLSRLREAGLIESTRGRGGGYRLARRAEAINAFDIFLAVEDSFQPVQCLDGGHGCVIEHSCTSRDAWGEISAAISGGLSGIILADLVAKRAHVSAALPVRALSRGAAKATALAPQECRAPKRRMSATELS